MRLTAIVVCDGGAGRGEHGDEFGRHGVVVGGEGAGCVLKGLYAAGEWLEEVAGAENLSVDV